MKKIKYDVGRIVFAIIGFVFFGFLSFPVFLNFHAERVLVYIIFFIAGFFFFPLTNIKEKDRITRLRFGILIIYYFSIFALKYTQYKVFSGILAFSAQAGFFLYWIIDEIYKLKRVSKRKRKDTTEDNEEMR